MMNMLPPTNPIASPQLAPHLARHLARRHVAGFTLTELLVAIAVLLVVMIGIGRIFSSASRVTTQGQANADVLQEAAAIERQMRKDFSRISPQGYIAIVSYAVRNNIHSTDPERFLDPGRPADAYIRADQIVFLANGAQTTENLSPALNQGSTIKVQALASRVYYGHAFQLPGAPIATDLSNAEGFFPPWRIGAANLQDFTTGNAAGTTTVPFQPARRWLLARQAILLGDPRGVTNTAGVQTYLIQASFTNTIFDPTIRNGRTDVAIQTPMLLRQQITDFETLSFNDVRANILNSVFFPRAERTPPSMNRPDIAMSNNTISTGASDFIIEWSYDRATLASAGLLNFTQGDRTLWFGMPDPDRGVDTLRAWQGNNDPPADLIETVVQDPNGDGSLLVYTAVFGYRPDLTPWPDALRITLRQHDVSGRLSNGRLAQFVIDLPKRR